MYLSEEAGNFRKLKSHGQYSKKNIQYDTENFFQGSWETHFNSVNSYHITTRLERFCQTYDKVKILRNFSKKFENKIFVLLRKCLGKAQSLHCTRKVVKTQEESQRMSLLSEKKFAFCLPFQIINSHPNKLKKFFFCDLLRFESNEIIAFQRKFQFLSSLSCFIRVKPNRNIQ